MIGKIIHKYTSSVVNGEPKLPTSNQLDFGELAINYAKGYETISLKNDNEEIVEFKTSEYYENKIKELYEIIESLKDFGYRSSVNSNTFKYCGITNTKIEEGSTIKDIVLSNESYTVDNGCIVLHNDNAFIFNGEKWDKIKYPTDINNKQDELVSGINIKTINNQNILGSGNITIDMPLVVNDLNSVSTENSLSAAMGKKLNDKIEIISNNITNVENNPLNCNSNNLLLNSNFEGYSYFNIPEWTIEKLSNDSYISFNVSTFNNSYNTIGFKNLSCSQRFNSKKDTIYTLSFNVKGNGAVNNLIVSMEDFFDYINYPVGMEIKNIFIDGVLKNDYEDILSFSEGIFNIPVSKDEQNISITFLTNYNRNGKITFKNTNGNIIYLNSVKLEKNIVPTEYSVNTNDLLNKYSNSNILTKDMIDSDGVLSLQDGKLKLDVEKLKAILNN